MRVILIGSQGSGKGVQSRLLAITLNVPAISVGKLFREHVRRGTTIGKIARKYIDKGELVPDEYTVRMLRHRLQRKDCRKGWILDGFPRTVEQAQMFNDLFNVDKVIYLHVSDKTAITRISSRIQCINGHVYGINQRPKKKRICDIDGKKLFRRKDDLPSVVKKRLKIFHKTIRPILKLYGNHVNKVNGNASVQTVHKRILVAIRSFA